MKDCPISSYQIKNVCIKCSLNCKNCLSEKSCVDCINFEFVLIDGFCILCSKIEGYYLKENICLKCH